jgi:hypothetical protein
MFSGLAVSICGLEICHNARIVFRDNDGTAVHFCLEDVVWYLSKHLLTFMEIVASLCLPCSQNHVQNQFVPVHVFRPVSLRCFFILRAVET